jgi:hypothetical protein
MLVEFIILVCIIFVVNHERYCHALGVCVIYKTGFEFDDRI